jgi:ankyrin repeat protein
MSWTPWSTGDFLDDLTPFDLAAENGHAVVAQLFVRYGYRVDRESSHGRTALWHSCKAGNIAVVKFLLEEGLSPDERCGAWDWSLLHPAVDEDDDAIVRALVHAGADLNASDDDGNRPIHFALENGSVPMLGLLIELGADVVLGDDYYTPLDSAIASGNMDMIRLLSAEERKARLRSLGITPGD